MGLLFCVDVETTALEPSDGAIVELAAVCLKDGQVADRFSTLVWPGREFLREKHRRVLSDFAKIDPLRLMDEDVPDTYGARLLFLRWLCGNAGVPIPKDAAQWQAVASDGFAERTPLRLTSFNVEFDRKFLAGLTWDLHYHCRALAPAEIEWAPCVMLAASEDLGRQGKLPRNKTNTGYRWPKLSFACEQYGIPFTETHRALNDAEAAAQIALRLGVE